MILLVYALHKDRSGSNFNFIIPDGFNFYEITSGFASFDWEKMRIKMISQIIFSWNHGREPSWFLIKTAFWRHWASGTGSPDWFWTSRDQIRECIWCGESSRPIQWIHDWRNSLNLKAHIAHFSLRTFQRHECSCETIRSILLNQTAIWYLNNLKQSVSILLLSGLILRIN